MAIRVPFAQATGSLEKICDAVSDKQEIVIISRGGPRDVAVIRAVELVALMETAHQLALSRRTSAIMAATG
jgi:PHD/YefM family antitoxin component YafN of YafNO toxin-antitoxin module